jgi:hypothetical protein
MAEQKNKLSYCNLKQLKRAFTIGELMPVIMVSKKNLIARRSLTNMSPGVADKILGHLL